MTNDYHNLYLKCDVLLLADVFEKLGNSRLKSYELCPSHYFSAPALSWDTMPNVTKIELELISHTDMYLSLEKSMRGAVSYISKRYIQANNLMTQSKNQIMLYT